MSQTAAPARDGRSLGLGLATALGIGNMVGSGVILLPASLAPYRGMGLIGWGVTAVADRLPVRRGGADDAAGQ